MIVRATTRAKKIVTLNVQPGSLTAAFDERTVLAYDRAGRLWSAFFFGCTFRRGLDGGMLGKWTEHGKRDRRRLGRNEAALVVDCSAALMSSLADGAMFDAPPHIVPEIEKFLHRAMR